MKRILLAIALITVAIAGLNAQQDARYTQYMFNKLVFNPAYAGTGDGLELSAIYRNQWVNIEGAPQEFSISAHTPFGGKKQFGLGGFFEFDQIGVHSQYRLFLDYAYKFAITPRARLSIGVSGGLAYRVSNFTDLTSGDSDPFVIDPNDIVFGENVSKLLPNFGLGLYFYNPNKYYLGVSAPHLINNDLGFRSAHQSRHYHFMGGLVFPLGESLKLKPSVLVKWVPNNAPIQYDANLMFLIKEMIWLGASYRIDNQFNSESLDFIAALELKNGFRIGYAYDFTLSDLSNYTSGSHEIMLGYAIKGKDVRIRTPRYF